jgi:hypothetical protein
MIYEDNMQLKSLDIDRDCYMFETLEQLVDILKEEGYNVSLNISKKGRIRSIKVIL